MRMSKPVKTPSMRTLRRKLREASASAEFAGERMRHAALRLRELGAVANQLWTSSEHPVRAAVKAEIEALEKAAWNSFSTGPSWRLRALLYLLCEDE